MKRGSKRLGARLRIVLEPDIVIGPGKAAILEEIKRAGSIAAAGRRMGMSYKRAWYMVETMNRCFKVPVVITVKGGKTGGGARLTSWGEEVLLRYRRMEKLSAEAIEPEMRDFRSALETPPED